MEKGQHNTGLTTESDLADVMHDTVSATSCLYEYILAMQWDSRFQFGPVAWDLAMQWDWRFQFGPVA